MYSLNIIGTQIENFLGRFKFLIYFGSTFTASLMSALITRDYVLERQVLYLDYLEVFYTLMALSIIFWNGFKKSNNSGNNANLLLDFRCLI